MKLPARVTICEVGPRDGFQIEPEFIPTDQKVEVVDLLSAAGVPRIEVTSFVHPKVVPALRDAEEVVARIRRRPGTRYAALVPNEKGAVRAVDAGVDAIHTVLSASVPSARPPSVRTRSATSSTIPSSASYCAWKNLCRSLNCGPTTFQW